MSKSVQLEVFVRIGKTLPRFLGADFELFIKIPADDLKKVGRFSQNMFGLAPSGLATYIRGSWHQRDRAPYSLIRSNGIQRVDLHGSGVMSPV